MLRAVVAVLVVMGALALPASAATVDPRLLVLGQAYVPAGYEFDRDNSLRLPRSLLRRSSDEASRTLLRAGFQDSFYARYVNASPPHWRYVGSGAYLFRSADGALTAASWMLRSGFPARGRSVRRIAFAEGGWLATSRSRDEGTAVLWRHGHVVAFVHCWEMRGHRALALALAREQQRRIRQTIR